MTPFILHPWLVRDCVPVTRLTACQLLLMNDSRYPWLILVPEYGEWGGLDDLPPELLPPVWADMARTSQALRHLFQPDRLNVAALGNMVPQLHIHVIARFKTDDAWPHPVWGKHPPLPYETVQLQQRLEQINTVLNRQQSETILV